jgi:hypothetical protein
MPNDPPFRTPAGERATNADAPAMAPEHWVHAEAEAEADLIDADLESSGAREIRLATVATRSFLRTSTELTDADLAEAECESDLSHVDHAA